MSTIELQPLPRATVTADGMSVNSARQLEQEQQLERAHGNSEEYQLAPVDGGIAAWKLLWAAFAYEALLWGWSKYRIVKMMGANHARLSAVVWCIPRILFNNS